VKIATLTKKLAKDNLKKLVEIDKEVIDKYGSIFSSEGWNSKDFLKDLNGKWKYSRAALDRKDIVGYCISSLLDENTLYIHKIVVKPHRHNKGIGTALIENLSSKKASIVLEVNVENESAIKFYKNLNFKKISGNRFSDYLIKRDKLRVSRIFKGFFIEKGYPDKKIVLERSSVKLS